MRRKGEREYTMFDFRKLIGSYENCECGAKHECAIKDIVIEKGAVNRVGEILEKNAFPKKLLLVADKTTIKAAENITKSLDNFSVTYYIYDTLRVAKMSDVRIIEACIDGGTEAVLSVGTGSLNDIARLACAEKNVPLCLFGTAPSMDGFASYSAPIVDGNFKITYPAKCPEVIIADTEILAKAPVELKSAGFGDMVSKYIALIDWRVSHLVKGESYCEKVAELTRYAVDKVMAIADRITLQDEESAAAVFEGLLLTGIAMSFTKTSRPGSGTEHIMAHFIECVELLENKIPYYHGEDVGVTTLMVLDYYKKLAELKNPKFQRETVDWNDVYDAYGELADDVRKINAVSTATDGVDPEFCEKNWNKIVEIVNDVPSVEEVKNAMKKAGCAITSEDIHKSPELIAKAWKYHPYMRNRLSLKRLSEMIVK